MTELRAAVFHIGRFFYATYDSCHASIRCSIYSPAYEETDFSYHDAFIRNSCLIIGTGT